MTCLSLDTGISEDVKDHFRIYETYSDEFTKPERRLVQDFKSIMRYYNVPLRGAFTEFDNIDDVLASAYVLKKYYVVEYEDGSVKSYNEHFQEMKSNGYTIRNGEQVALPYLTIPENARNAFYNSDFVKTYIAPDAQVENVYWLSGESSMMGTAIYYRTSVGDYVYYYYDAVVKYTLPEGNNQIFASKYFTYLPTEEELKRELRIDEFQKLDDN